MVRAMGYVVLVLCGVFAPAMNVYAGNFDDMWAKKVGSSQKIIFWSTRPERYVWLQAGKTIDDMIKDDIRQPVRIISARNEYETRQFVITPSLEMKGKINDVELTVSDFTCLNGKVIGKDNIQIEWLRYSLHRVVRGGKVKRETFVPDPLIMTNRGTQDWQDDKGEVTEPTNTPFWVTIYVPKETAAGVYKGNVSATVTLKEGKSLKFNRAIELKVLDITLPHMTHFRTGLFRSMLKYADWFIPDMARYRISFGGLPSEPGKLLKYGRLMHKLGVQLTFVGPWLDIYDVIGATPSYRKAKPRTQAIEDCKKCYERIYPVLKREGWVHEVYARMPDEFRSERIAENSIKYIKLLRQWAPGIRTMVTSTGDNPKLAEMMADYIDIWCAGCFTKPHYQKLIQEGDEVWGYIHSYTWFPVYRGNFAGALRYLFWTFRRYNVTGACYWSVGPRGRFTRTAYGIIHDDAVSPGDGTLYYPILEQNKSVGRVAGMSSIPPPPYWHSARMTLIRDGIEDTEYLWLMDKLVKKAGNKIRRAPGLTTKINQIKVFVKKFVHQKASPAEVDRVRGRIASVIRQLQQVCKSGDK